MIIMIKVSISSSNYHLEESIGWGKTWVWIRGAGRHLPRMDMMMWVMILKKMIEDGHKDDENSSEGREIVTRLGDEQADSRLLFNFGDLGGDLVIVIEKIQLSFPFWGRSISPGSIAHFSVFLSGDIVVDAVDHLLQLFVLSKVARRPFRLRAGSVVRVAVSKIGSILSKSPRHLVFWLLHVFLAFYRELLQNLIHCLPDQTC